MVFCTLQGPGEENGLPGREGIRREATKQKVNFIKRIYNIFSNERNLRDT